MSLDLVLVVERSGGAPSCTPGRGSARPCAACRGRSSTGADRRCAPRPPFEARFMMWMPISSKRRMISVRCSSAGSRLRGWPFRRVKPSSSTRSGPMPDAPTMHAAAAVTDEEVAADAVRVLAVEDALGRHRAEAPDDQADLLAAETAEALLLLERLVVAERAAAHADRQARRLAALHVDVAGDRVTGFVDRDRARLAGHVVDADRGARLERRPSPRRGAATRTPRCPRGARTSAPASRPARSSRASSRT